VRIFHAPIAANPTKSITTISSSFEDTKTLCRACGERFILPRLEELFPEPLAIVGGANSTIRYASPFTPQAAVPTHGVWRFGKAVVIERGAELPCRCICCNEPGNGKRIWVKLWWKPAETSLVLGVLSKPREEMIVFKMSLCAVHQHKLQQSRQIGNMLMLISLPVLLACFAFRFVVGFTSPVMWLAPVVVFGTGIAWRVWNALSLAAVNIDADEACVAGFGKKFLASLEPIEEARSKARASTASILEQLRK
jgi:hypothetical protein